MNHTFSTHILPQDFKQNLLKDFTSQIKTVPANGIPNEFMITDEFEEVEFLKTHFQSAFLIEDPRKTGLDFPEQLFEDPCFLETCYEEELGIQLNLQMCDSSTYRPKSGSPLPGYLVGSFMRRRGRDEDADTFCVEDIPTPAVHMRHCKRPRFCEDYDLGECARGDKMNPNPELGQSIVFNSWVMSKKFFRPFKTVQAGGYTWLYLLEGTAVVFYVDARNISMLDYFSLVNFRKEADGGFAPECFKEKVKAFVLMEGQLYMFPGSWPHAFLSLGKYLAYTGSILTTVGIPQQIRCYEMDQELTPAAPLVTEFDRILDQSTPMILSNLYTLSYFKFSSTTKYYDLMEAVTNFLDFRQSFPKNNKMYEHLVDLKASQEELDKTKGVLIHISGATFKTSSGWTYVNRKNFLRGCLLSNVLLGDRWRSTFLSNPGDPDHFDGYPDTIITCRYNLDQWLNEVFGEAISLEPGEPWELKAVAGKNLSPGDMIGEVRGELILESQFRIRYGTNRPRGKLRFLRNLYAFNAFDIKFDESVYVDSTIIGGVDQFFKHGPNYNCEAIVVIVENTYKLGIRMVKDVRCGADLIFPPWSDQNELMQQQTRQACFRTAGTNKTNQPPTPVKAPPHKSNQSSTKARTPTPPPATLPRARTPPPNPTIFGVPKASTTPRMIRSRPSEYRDAKLLELESSEYTVNVKEIGTVCLTPRNVVIDSPQSKYQDIRITSARNMRYFLTKEKDSLKITAVKESMSLPDPPTPSRVLQTGPSQVPYNPDGAEFNMDPTTDFGRRREGYRQFPGRDYYEEWNNSEKGKIGKGSEKYFCADVPCKDKKFSSNTFHKHLCRFHVPYPYNCPWPNCSHGSVTPHEVAQHYVLHKTWDPIQWEHRHGQATNQDVAALLPLMRVPTPVPPTVRRSARQENVSNLPNVPPGSSSGPSAQPIPATSSGPTDDRDWTPPPPPSFPLISPSSPTAPSIVHMTPQRSEKLVRKNIRSGQRASVGRGKAGPTSGQAGEPIPGPSSVPPQPSPQAGPSRARQPYQPIVSPISSASGAGTPPPRQPYKPIVSPISSASAASSARSSPAGMPPPHAYEQRTLTRQNARRRLDFETSGGADPESTLPRRMTRQSALSSLQSPAPPVQPPASPLGSTSPDSPANPGGQRGTKGSRMKGSKRQ